MGQEAPRRNNGLYVFPPFAVDLGRRLLLRDGEPVRLRPKAFDLLLNLVESAGTSRSREELIRAVWPDTIVEEHGLTVGMSALRKALGDEDGPPRFIMTVRGYGYCFIAPVRYEPAQAGVAEEAPPPAATRPTYRWIAPAALALMLAAGLGYFVSRDEAPQREPASPVASVSAATPSIAVLPFEFIGEEQGNAYFALGMRQTILARLARMAGIRVMSRTSSDGYPSHPENLREIAAALGVTTVLEGHVQASAQQVLINLQLIEADSGRHLWAGSYTRTLDDVIEVENDVAAHVASALEARLLPADAMRNARAPTNNSNAYVAFLKANYFEDQVTNRNNAVSPDTAAAEATTLYRQAIELDPDFALAHARLSILQSYAYWSSIVRTPEAISSARNAATRAIALDRSLPEAWLAMGYVHYYGQRDYATAIAAFERVLELVPSDVNAKVAIAYIQRRQGRLDDAIEGMRQASLLDPRNSRWPYEMGLTLMAQRKYIEADEQYARALAIEPLNFASISNRVYAALLAGDKQRAVSLLDNIASVADPLGQISALRFEIARLEGNADQAFASLPKGLDWVQVPDMGGNVPRSMMEAEAWALRGDRSHAREALEKSRQMLQAELVAQPDNPDTWSALGIVFAGLGQREEALAAARRATELVPVSRDLVDGVLYTTVLARVHARLGEAAMTVKLLRELLQMPGGMFISVPMLKMDPQWDAIRADAAFQALYKD